MKILYQIVDLLIFLLTTFGRKPKSETNNTISEVIEITKEISAMPIDFENIKNVALDSLKDSGAKEEMLDLLKKHKPLFTEELRGYLKAIVSMFGEEENQTQKYEEFLAALEDEKLVAEIGATADKISSLVSSCEAKKELIKDLKEVATKAVTKALIAALMSAVGPASGPLAILLNSR